MRATQLGQQHPFKPYYLSLRAEAVFVENIIISGLK
jgi:hypothetical protein